MSNWRGRGGARGTPTARAEPYPRGFVSLPSRPVYPPQGQHIDYETYAAATHPRRINSYADLQNAQRYDHYYANYNWNAHNHNLQQQALQAHQPPPPLPPPRERQVRTPRGQYDATHTRSEGNDQSDKSKVPVKSEFPDFVWHDGSPIKSTRVRRPWGHQTEKAYFALDAAGQLMQTFPKGEIKEPADDTLPADAKPVPTLLAQYKSALSFEKDALLKPSSPIPETINSFINLASDDEEVDMDISDSDDKEDDGVPFATAQGSVGF